ncbi:hypothetical protein SAMN03159343_1881 [Klenkia marina]|uniref:Mce-associated membrane protein n=1 Tax=Klenkia marina TaxID=1960309 RepID=A0A1G4Y073_9ACTN|nr:hypothetical protein [Klenkia marina]SCX46865.1 hypothetical protein SAMN03159343_1881 [Klenkia marina]
MTDQDRTGDDGPGEDSARPRPRPTPRPRTGGGRPSPRPRVAGSRRADDDVPATPSAEGEAAAPRRRPAPRPRAEAAPAPRPASRPRGRAAEPAPEPASERPGRRGLGRLRRRDDDTAPAGRTGRRSPTTTGSRTAATGTRTAPAGSRTVALVLAVLCVLAAAGGGWLLWERLHPSTVDPTIFTAAEEGVQAVYAYDYQDSDGSVQRKLDALTGDLRDQYETDLSSGGIIDTYQQVSATTSYDVLEVGLQQVNESQDQATLVVFGQYVVTSVNSGNQAAPTGSECTVTDDGAQSCTQTVRVTVTDTDDGWKISELTLLTSS